MTASAWLLLLFLVLSGSGWAWVFIADELHWRRTNPTPYPITGGTDVSDPPTQH